MYNIYLKNRDKKSILTFEKPFKTEEELEKYLMDDRELNSDIFIFKRQVRSGNKSKDIPDMIGIDKDKNVVIIENKNVMIDENIFPQILRYAIWAETNPDSIKSIWLEKKDTPDDIEIDWDNFKIRIIVFAPSIKPSINKLIGKINYNIELVEVKRFETDDSEIVVLNKLEEDEESRIKTTKGLENYDKEFYEKHRNKNSVDKFFRVVEEINKLNLKNGWNLEKKFVKYYTGFKKGFPIVFGVQWLGTRSFGFFFKIKKSEFNKFKKVCPYQSNYDEQWNQAIFKYEEGKTKIKDLEKTFQLVYDLFLKRY